MVCNEKKWGKISRGDPIILNDGDDPFQTITKNDITTFAKSIYTSTTIDEICHIVIPVKGLCM